jgi:hypothetical protein
MRGRVVLAVLILLVALVAVVALVALDSFVVRVTRGALRDRPGAEFACRAVS